MTAISRYARPAASALTPQTPAGPTNPPAAATASSNLSWYDLHLRPLLWAIVVILAVAVPATMLIWLHDDHELLFGCFTIFTALAGVAVFTSVLLRRRVFQPGSLPYLQSAAGGLPSRVFGTYWPSWDGPALSSLPSAYNTVWLFAAVPVGVYKELERELFRLRDADAGEIPESRRSWRFEDRASVTVICADLGENEKAKLKPYTDLNDPNYTELFTYANLDALVTLLNHLHSENPNATIRFCRASEATSDDLTNHLVLLGGIAWNDVTHRLNDSVGLPVRQVPSVECRSGQVFELQCGAEQGKQYIPRWRDDDPGTAERPGVLLEDVAMLARLPNPFNVLRTLTYCNGVHSRGVLGAVRCLTDPAVRENNERYLEESFADSDRFVVLMRVPLVGNRTITPSLSNPDTVLFGWPKNPIQG